MFRANHQRTGTYTDYGLSRLPNLKWKTAISLNTSPLNQLDNTNLAVENNYICLSLQDGTLTRLDSVTGQMIWQLKLGDKIISSPTILNGVAYCVFQQKTLESTYEYMSAVNLNSSQEIWKFELNRTTSFLFNFDVFLEQINPFKFAWEISPVIKEDTVYVNSSNGYLYALELSSGNQMWRFSDAVDNSISPPAIKDNTLVFASEEGKLYRLDANSGRSLWTTNFSFGNEMGSEPICPAIERELIVLNNGGELVYAFKLENGEQVWTFSESNQSFYYPTIAINSVFLRAYNNSNIYELDIETGRVSWIYNLESIPQNLTDVIVIADGVGYLWDNCSLKAISLYGKEEIWRYTIYSDFSNLDFLNSIKYLKGLQISPPIIKNRELYFISGDGYVYAFN